MTENGYYVLALEIENHNQFSDIFGEAVLRIVRDDLRSGFSEIGRELLQRYNVLSDAVCPSPGRYFIPFRIIESSILLDMKEQIGILTETASERIRMMLEKNLGSSTGSRLDFRVIISNLQENPEDNHAVDAELNFHFRSCSIISRPYARENRDVFKKIIDEKDIDIFFQSIVSLPEQSIAGYEALSRGPQNSPFYNADVLFGTAAHFNLSTQLELVCFEKALGWFGKIPPNLFITVNIGPAALTAPEFWEILGNVRFASCLPRLVIELTEHIPLQQTLELQASIRRLNAMGVRLSLDDTGCGYFDLNTVEKLKPQIVKLCITVISRIGRTQEIAMEIAKTVDKIKTYGALTLGEGVERKDQLEVLNQCNVKFAQGNYFDYPASASELFSKKS